VIPASALEGGVVDMRLFLGNALADRYHGAFTLRFDTVGAAVSGGPASRGAEVDFMYTLDNQGFRIEYAPPTSRDGIVIARRASSPMVIYFYLPEDTNGSQLNDQFGRQPGIPAFPPFVPPETVPVFEPQMEAQTGGEAEDWGNVDSY
jgi:hypothetical protein